MSVTASNSRGTVTEVMAADPELFAYFDQLVMLALGDDLEAHAWLAEMNDGPSPQGSLVRGDWRLGWFSDLSAVSGEDEGTSDITFMLDYFPIVIPPATDAPTGAATPEESDGAGTPSAPPAAAPVDGAAGDAGGMPFAASVARPGQVSTDPVILLQSAVLAALLVFLMPFPSQLFNSTLDAHEDEVRRWLRLDRIGSAVGGFGAFWGSWPGVAVFTLLAALLYGFLDPGFGFSLSSLATFVGMLVGIVLVTAAFAVPVVLAHRRLGDSWRLKVVPVSLLMGVACVLLSRLTGFQPGYLYGLLIGLAFARELSSADEGRATAIGAVLMLVVATVAWLGLGALPDGDGFGLVVVRTSLAALMVAGLEGVAFGLLPMRFLPGEPLYAWNRILWGVLLAIGAFAFFHILINPASGYLSDSSRTPLFTVVGLLVGFSLVSVAFWAWFRFRPSSPTEEPTVR
ncbi:MAG: hypothetical protein H0U86_09515 [Chloroflexi bacterium]|nr:hypothetical protein [Chloroflexota bacterium]